MKDKNKIGVTESKIRVNEETSKLEAIGFQESYLTLDLETDGHSFKENNKSLCFMHLNN